MTAKSFLERTQFVDVSPRSALNKAQEDALVNVTDSAIALLICVAPVFETLA